MANPSKTLKVLGEDVVHFVSFLNALATGWIFVIMLIMVCDILGRVIFNHPLTGTPEIVRISLVGIVFLQMPHTFWMGRHIRSDLIVNRLRTRYRDLLNTASFLFIALVFWGILFSSYGTTVTSWKLLEIEGEGALRVPVYPIRTIIMMGSFFTASMFTFRFIRNLVLMAQKKSVGR
ncbi:MAG: TRAP transporter small permease [Pseudomonadota bacterium]